jgi:diguanylate cyclase (GGDEF)-like protein
VNPADVHVVRGFLHRRPFLAAAVCLVAVGAAHVFVGTAAATAVAALSVVALAGALPWGVTLAFALVASAAAVLAPDAGRVPGRLTDLPALLPPAARPYLLVGVTCAALVGLAALALRREHAHGLVRDEMLATNRASRDLAAANAQAQDQLQRELQYWASHDPLTGLVNRTMFTRQVNDLAQARHMFGLVLVSLTGFADVNAAHGTSVGDQVLVAVGRRLAHVLREGDVVARVSGDEFAVIVAGLQPAQAQSTGDRLLQALATPVVVDGAAIDVHGRAGVAVHDPAAPTEPAELLRRTHLACAASSPARPVTVFASTLHAVTAEQARIEQDLRRALDAGEIVCHFQPLVATVDGRIAGVEALARWQHPERGLVSPADFIPAAERSGLIVPLGLEVLRQACRQLRSWNQDGYVELTMAVNVSARQLVEPGVVEAVADIVYRSGVDPRHVVLEITESLLVEDSAAAIETLWRLRGLGVRLAVDDFGTGYSSLSRLSEMPIDEIKIDKSFVDRLGAAVSASDPIIHAAIAMGHALGLTVVAEGIESHDQAASLRAVDCDLLQGYLLGKPQPAELVRAQLGTPVTAALLEVARHPSAIPVQRADAWTPVVSPAPLQ